MNILHIIHNLNREGAQVVLKNIACEPYSKETRHIVVAWKHGGPLEKTLQDARCQVYVVTRDLKNKGHKPGLTNIVKNIGTIIKNEQIDVIHAHMADAAFLATLLGRFYNLPFVVTHHSNKLTPSTGIKSFLWYMILLLSSFFTARHVAISQSVANQIKQKLRVCRQNIKLVANGVPLPTDGRIAKMQKRDLVFRNQSIPKGTTEHPVIVAVGRLVTLKGFEQLIDAAHKLKTEHPNLTTYIIGDGPLKAALQQKIDSYNLEQNVILTGAVGNVPHWLSKASVLVSTSSYEGIPMAILEGMAWRVPVVASDVTGTRDIVNHEKTGLLYQHGNVRALTSAINRILINNRLQKELAAKAYCMVENKYSTRIMNAAYQSVYQEALSS